MIGKAKAISYGINAIRYIKGESQRKKHPELIIHVCDRHLPSGMDAMGIWLDMKMSTANRAPSDSRLCFGDRLHASLLGAPLGLCNVEQNLRYRLRLGDHGIVPTCQQRVRAEMLSLRPLRSFHEPRKLG